MADFAAGTVAGIAGVIVGYPADTVKVRLQSQPYTPTGSPLYKGTWNCLSTIVKNESFFGLFKGMTSPMAGVGLLNALLFGVYGQAIRFQQQMSGTDGRPTLKQVFIAGCISGGVNSVVSCPLELGKIQMQNQGIVGPSGAVTPKLFKGPLDCLMTIYKTTGVKGIFRGFTATFLREVPSYGVYFYSYERLCEMLTPEGSSVSDLHWSRLLLAGGFGGIFGWISTYPTDVIKTKMQSVEGKGYKNTWECTKAIYREEGHKVFFRGLNATILRAFPTNAAILLVYTLTMRVLTGSSVPTSDTETMEMIAERPQA